MVENLSDCPDHSEVTVTVPPALKVLYSEVGLMGSDSVGIGGGTQQCPFSATRSVDGRDVTRSPGRRGIESCGPGLTDRRGNFCGRGRRDLDAPRRPRTRRERVASAALMLVSAPLGPEDQVGVARPGIVPIFFL